MHNIAVHALRRAALPPISKNACRVVGGIRCSAPRLRFHKSALSLQKPATSETAKATSAAEYSIQGSQPADLDVNEGIEQQVEDVEEDGVEEEKTDVFAEDSPNPGPDGEIPRKNKRVSRARRRQSRPEGLPPATVPDWFLEKNVKYTEDLKSVDLLVVSGERRTGRGGTADTTIDPPVVESVPEEDTAVTVVGDGEKAEVPANKPKYSVHEDIYDEIYATLKAGLALRPPRAPAHSVLRPHTLLQCPKDGGSCFLDAIVETMVKELETDLIQISPQDLSQVLGSYVDENLAWTAAPTSLLSYETQGVAGKLEQYANDTIVSETAEGGDEEGDMGGKPSSFEVFLNRLTPGSHSKSTKPTKRPGLNVLSPAELSAFLQPPKPTTSRLSASGSNGMFSMFGGSSSQSNLQSSDEQWNSMKIGAMMDALMDSVDAKRAMVKSQTGEPAAVDSATDVKARDVIVQLQDYKGLVGSARGGQLLESLQTAINKRWREGRNIILVGTTSTDDCDLTKVDILNLQSDIVECQKRTILVTPERKEDQDLMFVADEKARIRGINLRHVQDMLVRLTDGNEAATLIIDLQKGLDNAVVFSTGLEDAVWTYARVHRLSVTIIGLASSTDIIDGPLFAQALKLLEASDDTKAEWGAAELKEEAGQVDEMIEEANSTNLAKDEIKEKIKKLRKTLSTHEKKLLGGVIIPADITTTFNHVHVPKETIMALKTLTSLSLLRPEAFSYGVLATNKIPGLLLYGPPGTGKTLLAKAVAKESGAVVLEISGAEVNDMFVGEGEKNVKAIFSLAKKLSPCVVFIDEADAILASRSGAESKRATHRETINQFLREWDGMNDLSAFIMVATNRPFDLDEAVLRRLPRRVLVDLPTEKDRESILNIHLKDEVLDESVSLADLAKNTPYYSGSDLKNLSVAAALSCIREENELGAKHSDDEPYAYPEKRLLTESHFHEAMNEISASISDDMSTLTAIRKFDEKYGDRKGRRKKTANLGFGGATQETDSEAGRVRKLEALKE
ncbi:mitochondrial AAA ATPase-like protein [Calycina marina]|uniref:Mitochondrial AAA ATPase-like protein n=1 Tax=Calycina marina TaxID=1763456 RepID=A0A9P8CIS2_9HELO|nr:mitochondrial AAA ATPase-like protein [Calycina marina]